MNVAQLLEQSGRWHADRPALVAGDWRWTYAELDAACSVLAGRLERLGLRPGDRLGLRAASVGGRERVGIAHVPIPRLRVHHQRTAQCARAARAATALRTRRVSPRYRGTQTHARLRVNHDVYPVANAVEIPRPLLA